MSHAILRARSGIERTFRDSPFIDTWLFESSLASVQSADSEYLEAVEECDLFLWLVTPETSQGTASEVALALKVNRPILALELDPKTPRSEDTGKLLSLVREQSTTAKNVLDEDFEAVVADTVWKQLVDAWRGKPALARKRELAMQWQMSRSRLIRGWTQFGVAERLATELVDDPQVGGNAPNFAPGPDVPAMLLTGPSGAGKSLLAERIHQQAIRRATEDALMPVPLFVRARDVNADLEEYVRSRCTSIGEVRDFGVALTLDGLSEIAHDRARQLTGDAVVLMRGWRGTTIVATSTGAAGLSADMTVREVGPMSYKDAEKLVARIAGVEDYSAYFLPDSVTQAMRLPLYAVLLGGLVREHGVARTISQAELLAAIASRSLGGRRLSADMERTLRRAALATLSVPSASLGSVLSPEEQDELLTLGVLERDATGELNFGLEIVRAWYAAHAILVEEVDFTELPHLGEAWVDVLALAAAMKGTDARSRLVHEVLRTAPAFAFELVPPGASGIVGEATADAVGNSLRDAHEAIAAGLGPIAPWVCPVGEVRTSSGDSTAIVLSTLGVHMSASWIATGWSGSAMDPRVVEMPPPRWTDVSMDWLMLRQQAFDLRNWDPVQYALDEWRGWLEEALKARTLPCLALDKEHIWSTARLLANEQTVYERPIPIETLRERVRSFGDSEFVALGRRLFALSDLRSMLEPLQSGGLTSVTPPWPGPDIEPPVDSRFYTPERLLQRAQFVYETAIGAYRSLVLDFFPSFAPRLAHFQILPARLVGRVQPRSGARVGDLLVAYWQPLPQGSDAEVVLTLALENSTYDPNENQRIWDVFRVTRPDMRRWPGRSMQVLHLWNATPASNVVYEWLWDDLKAIKWVEGFHADWDVS